MSRKSRGTGHLASSSFTTKRTRNGRDPRRILLFASSSTIYSREQSTKTSPTSSNLFIYLFIFFFSEKEEEEEARKTSALPANHSWHTQTTQNSIQARRCFELGGKFVLLVFRDTYIHFLRAERERERKNRSVILSLELCINFHRF